MTLFLLLQLATNRPLGCLVKSSMLNATGDTKTEPEQLLYRTAIFVNMASMCRQKW